MRAEPFRPEHLWQIDLQPAQRSWHQFGSAEYAQGLAAGTAYSFRVGDELIACAGVLDVSHDEGHLWGFLSVSAQQYMLRSHRAAVRLLRMSGKRTIVATSEATFAEGGRWLEMLGFTFVEPLPAYGPAGETHLLYRREF